ncbi:MAG: response regulator [Planctomycetes bacterium]|nr:response regulator [Planctomycetota bacterium]
MKKILIVDDSMTSRLLFKTYFPKDYTATIEEANSCETALAKAKELNPDMIFLDYNMPGRHGIDIAQALIDAGITAKLILCTANLQAKVVDTAKKLGFSAIMEKPITTERIISVLGQDNI